METKRYSTVDVHNVAATLTREDIEVLALAKNIKLVVKGKPLGSGFGCGGICFTAPVNIDASVPGYKIELIRSAGKLIKVAKFNYNHSTVGYKYKYIGPKIEECLRAVSDNLSEKQLESIERNGAVFTVEEKSAMTRNPFLDTAPVAITVYQSKGGKLPVDIMAQNIKLGNEEFSPAQISSLVLQSRTVARSSGRDGK